MGSESEDVYTSYLSLSPLFDEKKNYVRETKSYCSVKKINEDSDAVTYVDSLLARGSKQISRYYHVGKSIFVDYLPKVSVQGKSISTAKLQSLLKTLTGHNGTIERIITGIPDKMYLAKAHLQQNYGYNVLEDLMHIGKKFYTFGSAKYDSQYDQIVITCNYVGDYVINTVEIDYYLYTNSEYTANITYNDTTYEVPGYKLVVKKYKNVVKEYTPLKTTKVFYTEDVEEGVYLSSETFKYTYRTSNVPAAIATDYEDEVDARLKIDALIEEYKAKEDRIILDTKEYNLSDDNFVKRIASVNTSRYFVSYYVDDEDDNDIHYVFVSQAQANNAGLTTNPIKEIDSTQYSELNCTPIALLRHNKTNLTDLAKMDKDKNEILTKKRYTTTQRLFKAVQLDLEDITKQFSSSGSIGDFTEIFLQLAVRPKDSGKGVSKYLYHLFSMLFTLFPPSNVNDLTTTGMFFEETSMQLKLNWTPIADRVTSGTIGPMGTCTHTCDAVNYNVTKRQHYVIQSRCTSKDHKQRTVKVTSYYQLLGKNTKTGEVVVLKTSGKTNKSYTNKNISSFYKLEAQINKGYDGNKNNTLVDDIVTFVGSYTKPSGANPIGKVPVGAIYLVQTSPIYYEGTPTYEYQFSSPTAVKNFANTAYSDEQNAQFRTNYLNQYYLNYDRHVQFNSYVQVRDVPYQVWVGSTSDGDDIYDYVYKKEYDYTVRKSYQGLYIQYQLDASHVRTLILNNVYCDFYIRQPEGTDRHGSGASGDQFFIPLLWKPFLKLGVMERVDVFGKCLFLQVHAVHYEEVETGGWFNLGSILEIFGYIVTFVTSYVTFGLTAAIFLTAITVASSFIQNPIIRAIIVATTFVVTAGMKGVSQGVGFVQGVVNGAVGMFSTIGAAITTTVNFAISAVSAVLSINQAQQQQELVNQAEAFQSEYESVYSTIEEASSTWSEDTNLSPIEVASLTIHNARTHYIEIQSPDQFLYNSVGIISDNFNLISTYTQKNVSDFTTNALRLQV